MSLHKRLRPLLLAISLIGLLLPFGNAQTGAANTSYRLCAMGSQNSGQLGDGIDSNPKIPVFRRNDIAQAALGENFQLYILTDGSLWEKVGTSTGNWVTARTRLGQPLFTSPTG